MGFILNIFNKSLACKESKFKVSKCFKIFRLWRQHNCKILPRSGPGPFESYPWTTDFFLTPVRNQFFNTQSRAFRASERSVWVSNPCGPLARSSRTLTLFAGSKRESFAARVTESLWACSACRLDLRLVLLQHLAQRGWREISRQITKCSRGKTIQPWITFDIQLKNTHTKQ